MLQKFAGPLVGALFVGAPVRPHMLNMPKSASGLSVEHFLLNGTPLNLRTLWRYINQFLTFNI